MRWRGARSTVLYGRPAQKIKRSPFAPGTPLGMAARVLGWNIAGQFVGLVSQACPHVPEPLFLTTISLVFTGIVLTARAICRAGARRLAIFTWLVLAGWLALCVSWFSDPSDISTYGLVGHLDDPSPIWPPWWHAFAQHIMHLSRLLGNGTGPFALTLALWVIIPFVYRAERFQTILVLSVAFASGVTLGVGFAPMLIDPFADVLGGAFLLRWLASAITGVRPSRSDAGAHRPESIGGGSTGPERPLYESAEHVLEAIGNAVIWLSRVVIMRRK